MQSGGSMKMWKWYFGQGSRIFGVDINRKCKQFEEEGVRILIGDEGDRSFLQDLRKIVGPHLYSWAMLERLSVFFFSS
jgi:hypothetical protein